MNVRGTATWTAFVESAQSSDHAVQLYDDVGELARTVAAFLDAGFDVGAPALVIATADHRRHFEESLAAAGRDVAELERRGLLRQADAEELLDAFMDGDLPSPERFATVVGREVDELAARSPERTIRAFGEMVDVLWKRGQERAAIALEELWNELASTRSFALLCGYHLDLFDLEIQQNALPKVFGAHTHARPIAEPSRLAAAVDLALAETVGPVEAARVYLDSAENMPLDSIPRAQAVLGWLSVNDSPLAGQILQRVKSHYAQMRSAPSVPAASS
jgi:hypothetical protein